MSLFNPFSKIFGEKDFKKHVDQLFAEERIKPPLHSESRLRASGLVAVCPRFEALRSKAGQTVVEKLAPKTSRTFRLGRVWENLFRDEVLGDAGIVLGKWSCMRCEHVPEEVKGRARYPKPKECGACGHSRFSFVEEKFIDDDAGVEGHNDGFLYWNNEYAILELKTANAYNYSSLKVAPSENHVGQVQIYMAMHRYQMAVIIYLNKDTSDLCYHWVPFNPKIAQSLLEKGRQIKRYFKDGTLPDRACINAVCQRAVKCAFVEECFKS